jgi:hypothetical protein
MNDPMLSRQGGGHHDECELLRADFEKQMQQKVEEMMRKLPK